MKETLFFKFFKSFSVTRCHSGKACLISHLHKHTKVSPLYKENVHTRTITFPLQLIIWIYISLIFSVMLHLVLYINKQTIDPLDSFKKLYLIKYDDIRMLSILLLFTHILICFCNNFYQSPNTILLRSNAIIT